ncbi:fimbrial protein [Herbaspirillum sp. SJZ099]|uniref:fimbrial protein n=1 Tax=Herbaspirillum sp. SJZ099 TaxID=2572916 RepID=UPI0011A10C2D|nr:type 1 fimbrial protein [Herbaspirillum sp. SJZ099]TWC67589.1 type 1 fimbria pilin [Herbaspirillum sp. SJZ099]
MRNQSISRIVGLAFCLALSISAASHAADGTLQFHGALVEAGCSVSVAQAGFNQDAVERVTRNGSHGVTRVEGGSVQLKMNCNSSQSLQLSFEGRPSENRSGFDAGIAGVEMLLSSAGQALDPGKAIPIALTGKKERHIDIATALRRVAGAPGNTNGGKIDGAILISMNYR